MGGLVGLLILLFLLVSSVSAHPLDEYLQASYLTLTGDTLVVDVDLSPGVLVAARVLPLIDTDGSGDISKTEGQLYIDEIVKALHLSANDNPIPLTLNGVEYPPYLDLSAGTGVIRLHLSAPLPHTTPGDYKVFYENDYEVPGLRNTYLVNGFIQSGERDRFDITDQQRDYYQHTLSLSFSLLQPVAASSEAQVTVNSAGTQTLHEQIINYLHTADLSPLLLVVAVIVALVLGGLHALTPGHGKTLIAAYLVGSRGTVKHAMLLGGIVTITHTASVIVIGLMALFASQYIVPDLLVPMLEIGAGLLVVVIGLKLVVERWSALRASGTTSHPHVHRLPDSVRLRDLLAMGVSGGVVPCPEALGILLVAIGLNRISMGLALIVSFSLGLAVVLIALGVLLVRFKPLVSRWFGESGCWQRVLPLVSAMLITLLGSGVMLSALTSASIPPQSLIIVVALVLVVVFVYSLATRLLEKRSLTPVLAYAAGSSMAMPFSAVTTDLSLLPPRYRNGKSVSNAPMGSADLKFGSDGKVLWDQMWTDFCDLALAGGPPHRGTLLEPVSPEIIREKPEAYAQVVAEIARGLRMVTHLEVITDVAPGWVGLVCTDEAMALWMLRAIIVENVSVRREAAILFFPAGPDFRLDSEIKNVVTVVAKTHHYWTEHRDSMP